MKLLRELATNRLFQQLVSFSIVGVGATLTHAVIFNLVFQQLQFHHFIANILGFCLAFLVSYLGQFHWTFKEQAIQLTDKRSAFVKFFKTALLGFAVNLFWSFIILEFLQLHHYYYLALLTFVTPILIFVLNKFWVFK
ncbi:GtrA family protein [Psychromonas hadalis]|uniref:GtrA family protein n=1 Tax=Psychromonas hadalis TaxID=211669 RepID=UPI0003B3BFCA|nr:GtrA family protein [Psychromonas hadalis]